MNDFEVQGERISSLFSVSKELLEEYAKNNNFDVSLIVSVPSKSTIKYLLSNHALFFRVET